LNADDTRLRHPLAHELQSLRGSDWWPLLSQWQQSTAGQRLLAAVDARVAAGTRVYPRQVFRALQLTPRVRVRVVILGQDPYHGPGQAEGLAFSVPGGQRCPPSLRNVFQELQRDLGLAVADGCSSLVPWARQGVLLLNTSLTVEEGRAASHSSLGWHALTVELLKDLWAADGDRAFLLWGAHAQGRLAVAVGEGGALQGGLPQGSPARHLILRSNHPSPLSALRGPEPFIGCGHFGKVNRWLEDRGDPAIRWQLDPS
jgi:uracil-DNA glycosylase